MRTQRSYEFGPFRLDAAEHLLLRGGEVVPLTPRVFDTLVFLVENAGHLLEREQLLKTVWADSFVEEANLTVCISSLRKALGEQSNGHQFIETVPKRGYRFVADVIVVGGQQDELVLHEQTRSQVTIEQEEETDDQNEGKSEIETQAKILSKIRSRRRSTLQAFIASLLIIASMAAVDYWWKSVKARQPGAEIKSIAVLPFRQMGEGDKDDSVGLGMADVLITRLGSLNQIAVRPTGSVFKYIGTEQDSVSVGRELKVEAVLEGGIQKKGERIRVTAKLVRVRDAEILWADTFDGRHNDLFSLQDDMSQQVAVALSLNPGPEHRMLLTKRYTESEEAYRAYMKGRYFLNKRTMDGFRKGIEQFERAIEKDSNYPLPFAGLADGYSLLVNYHQLAPDEGFPKAKKAAILALDIDDLLAEAHASLAKIHHLYDWDWEAAEREFKRALELNPDYPTAHQWYGEYLISMGRIAEAKAEMKQALDLDPVSLVINIAQGFPYYYNHEYDDAIAAYQRALDLDPDFGHTHWRLNQVYVQKRMYDEAIAEDVASYSSLPETQAKVKAAYAVSGIRGYWERSVSGSEADLDRCCSRYIAWTYAYLGDKDNALKWLEKAYQVRSHIMVNLNVDPIFDDLRSDPRFADLLTRMRL